MDETSLSKRRTRLKRLGKRVMKENTVKEGVGGVEICALALRDVMALAMPLDAT
jgi:hypothetical protein